MKKQVYSTITITDLFDLQHAVKRLADAGFDSLYSIKLDNSFRFLIIEETLTDGSKVYNLEMVRL